MKRCSLLAGATIGLFAALGVVDASPDPEHTEVIIVPAGDKFLRWDGQVNRTYFIQASDPNFPLERWVWMPLIESGTGIEISHEILTTDDKAFFRLWYTDDQPPGGTSLEDWDADGDGVSNQAEIETYQINPLKGDSDGDGLIDGWEILYGLDPKDDGSTNVNYGAAGDPDNDGLTNGKEQESSTNPNDSDSDDDGITDGGEIDQGTDPNNASETPLAEWFILSGDSPQNEAKQRSRTLTVPAGETRMIIVASASEEYLDGWTDPITSPEYNDTVSWVITPTIGSGMSGALDVNDRHEEWLIDEVAGTTLKGFSPVHVEEDSFITAPESGSLTLQITLSATNIGDDLLPSTVMVGVLPIVIEVDKPTWTAASELRVAKWENAWVSSTGTFRTDFIDTFVGKEPDRFRIRVGTDELPSPYDEFFIETTGGDQEEHDDDPTKTTLVLDPGSPNLGIPSKGFLSKPMILVSDAVDNTFQNANAADDQTHIASLGSTVLIRSRESDGEIVFQRPVQSRASVQVHSVIVTPNGALDEDLLLVALDDIEQAREIYSQVGVDLFGTVEFASVPSGVDLSDGLLLDTTTTLGQLSAEALSLLDVFATPSNQNDIRCVYVASEISTGQTASGAARGMAFPFGWANASSFQRTFLVSLESYEKTVWSHELGHILLDGEGGHPSRPGNLMRATANYSSDAGSYSTNTRRLTEEQESMMYSKGVLQVNP